MLKNGEVSEMGTYDELLNKNGAFAEFISQFVSEMDEEQDIDSESKLHLHFILGQVIQLLLDTLWCM